MEIGGRLCADQCGYLVDGTVKNSRATDGLYTLWILAVFRFLKMDGVYFQCVDDKGKQQKYRP